MQNTYPRLPQNFQSQVPLAGCEWGKSRLDKLQLSGLIFDDSIGLPNRKEYNPTERVIVNIIHFPDASGIISMEKAQV
jgi:hypothetical protein